MATSQRRLSHHEASAQASYDLRLEPLPVGVARLMLAGKLRAGALRAEPGTLRPEPEKLRPEPEKLRTEPEKLRPEPVEGQLPAWHPQYPLPDSIDAIAMVFASHRAMLGTVNESPVWWIHQIIVDGAVVGDIGFHGPPDPDLAVEIGYSVVPAWRGRGVASQACALILQQAWQDGADIVIAETDADNVASQAVLLRNGFRRRPDGVFVINRPEAR
jgi:RimJ/RimL family protein N-acetyltransferase